MKKDLPTQESFIAQRYIMLRENLELYRLFFLSMDSNTNKSIILDRNKTVITAMLPRTWWVLHDALFTNLFLSLADFFNVRDKVKGSILKNFKNVEKFDSLASQLKDYKLGRYIKLIERLYRARDKYVAHSEKFPQDNFPITLKDLDRLENLFDEIEKKVLDKSIKDTSDYYHYKHEKRDCPILQEFDSMMNILCLYYRYLDDIDIKIEVDESMNKNFKKERDLLQKEAFVRRSKLMKARNLKYPHEF
jgi:hypothetical protein